MNSFSNQISNVTILTPNVKLRSIGSALIFFSTVVGFLFNFLLLLTILSKKELRRNQMNIFLISLIVDFILVISYYGLPVAFSYAIGKFPGSYLSCQSIAIIHPILLGSIMWHYAFISLHRFLFLFYSTYRSRILKSKRRFYIIFSLIASRLISIITMLPTLLNIEDIEYDPAELRCKLDGTESQIQVAFSLIVSNIIPGIIVGFCFMRTYRHISSCNSNVTNKCLIDTQDALKTLAKYQTNNELKEKTTEKRPKSNRNRQRSGINKMYALFVFPYLIVSIPRLILRLIYGVHPNSKHPNILVITTVIYSFLSFVTPFIIIQVNLDIHDQCRVLLNKTKRLILGPQ